MDGGSVERTAGAVWQPEHVLAAAETGVDGLQEVMDSIAVKRPVFHSEADFQHAFAWELQQRLPGAAVRRERPFFCSGRHLHLDLWVSHGPVLVGVEIKYKTRGLAVDLDGEHFHLRDQSAQ